MMMTHDSLIEQIAQSIFATMFNIEIVATDEPSVADRDTLRAMVLISGEWRGRVLLELTPDLTNAAAAEMLLLSSDEVTDTDRREITTELVNMIGGNIKSTLPGPSFLSLPSIVSEDQLAEHLHCAELVDDVTLMSEHGPVRVRLLSSTN